MIVDVESTMWITITKHKIYFTYLAFDNQNKSKVNSRNCSIAGSRWYSIFSFAEIDSVELRILKIRRVPTCFELQAIQLKPLILYPLRQDKQEVHALEFSQRRKKMCRFSLLQDMYCLDPAVI